MYYYLVLAALLAGCAFKGEEVKEAAASAINSQTTRLAEVSWEAEGGAVTVNRSVTGSKNFAIPDPVTLPPGLPDALKITFNSALVNGKLLQEPRVFISDQTDEKNVSPPLRLKGLLEPSGISISGLKTFFAVNKQQKGVIRVSLMNAVTGDEEASLGMTLLTTPLGASVSMISRDAVQDLELRKFSAPQLRTDLLYAFRLSNPNPHRTEFQLPVEVHGSIKKDFGRHDFVDRGCSTDTGVIGWTETYETRFFILPMDEGARDSWVARLSDAERTVTLEPGESRVVGVYASGGHVASFMDNGCPVLTPGRVQAVLSCSQECSTDSLGAKFDFDDRPDHRGNRCHQVKNYGEVPSGVESRGAYWVLDGQSVLLKARNAFLGRADDPATRALSFLPTQLSVF